MQGYTQLAGRVIALLVAAGVLGVLFNRANPLGIPLQASLHVDSSSTPVATARPVNQSVNDYHNEATSETPASTNPVALTWSEVRDWQVEHGALLVDVRPASAYRAGAIPGAISLPYSDLVTDLSTFQQRHDVESWLIFYCSDLECGLSELVAQEFARDFGYRHIAYLLGGFTEWQRQQANPPLP